MRRFLPLLSILVLVIPFLISPSVYASTYDLHPYGVTLNAKDALSFTDASASLFKGITWARLQFSWKKGDLAQDDAQMARAAKFGIFPDVVLQNPPDSALQPGCTQVPTASSITDYALQLYGRYGNQMKSVEVLNEEPSFDQGNASCRTAATYIPILKSVHDALRNAGYTGLLGMFGYTNYSSVAEVSDWFTSFYSDPSNPGHLIDYSNFHFYHHGAPPDTTLTGKPALMDVVNAIHSAALAANHGLQPSWVTEFGYCVDPTACSYPVTYQQQSDYEHAVFVDGENSGGLLDHAFIFTMSDENVPFNIINGDDSPRPAYTMVQNEAATHPTWR